MGVPKALDPNAALENNPPLVAGFGVVLGVAMKCIVWLEIVEMVSQ